MFDRASLSSDLKRPFTHEVTFFLSHTQIRGRHALTLLFQKPNRLASNFGFNCRCKERRKIPRLQRGSGGDKKYYALSCVPAVFVGLK